MKNKKRFLLSSLLVFFICGVAIPLFMINHKKVKADTISDLTNTTWTINHNFTTTNLVPIYLEGTITATQWGYISNFSSSFYYDQYQGIYNFVIGGLYDDLEDEWIYQANVIDFRLSTDVHEKWYSNQSDYNDLTITITGGDVTSASLISWLQDNATQQQPAPTGTEITHKYWASYLDINMTDNEIVGDNNISYKVLLNTYTDTFNDQTLTGLAFTGKLINIDDNYSYIYSTGNNDTLYRGSSNSIDNPMLLEFTLGDYMNDDLYDLMDDTGVWFDDARAYMAGTSFGSIYGFNRGVAYGEANSVQYEGLISSILNGMGNILNITVFPNITIGLLIGLPLLLGVFIIIIKILRG